MSIPDAVVVGSGPNGLAAAVTLARTGRDVLVIEGADRLGGGTRSAERTVPGLVHDECSAFHPLGASSPVLAAMPLGEHGLAWVQPDAPLAHPLDGGRAAVLERSVAETAAGLGEDGAAYQRLMDPLVAAYPELVARLRAPFALPRHHPLAQASFAVQAALPANALARLWFDDDPARALLAGSAAHAMRPLSRPPSGGFALTLTAAGHAAGWPVARGGSQTIADALASYLRQLGGRIELGRWVRSLADVPAARAVLFDTSPSQLARIAGDRFGVSYRRRLERFRPGPGVFKIDFALHGPVPWSADGCHRAGTVHLGGTVDEIAAGERAVAAGQVPQSPFVLVGQQSRFDRSRTPDDDLEAVWAYCHVPNGCDVDMSAAIEAQIERFAPGFAERVLARTVETPADLERRNPNFAGGDIAGGAMDVWSMLARPAPRLPPYATPDPRLFLCSASTPPGGGVHGACGYLAARSVLRRVWREAPDAGEPSPAGPGQPRRRAT